MDDSYDRSNIFGYDALDLLASSSTSAINVDDLNRKSSPRLLLNIGEGSGRGDAFFQTFSNDRETSNDSGALLTSGKLSGSNTSSYCRIGGLSTENSNNAILFTYENGEDKEIRDLGAKVAKNLATSSECPSCHKEFTNKFAFKVHLRSHTSKPYQCMICGRAFAQKNNVTKHIERHKVYPHTADQITGEGSTNRAGQKNRDFTFEQLGETSVKGAIIQRFEKCSEDASPSMTAYRCSYCNDLFHCYKCIKSHIPKHRDKKVFQCPLKTCRNLFSKLEEFLAHLATHNDHLAYDCPICGKVYNSLSDLGVHQCTHVLLNQKRSLIKKRSCRCLECGDIFKSLQALERHYAQTSHEYRCGRCKRVYVSLKRLRKHLKSHQPESKTTCTICQKTFAYARTLKWHMNHVHGPVDVIFCCSKCSKSFKRRDVLRRHENSVHNAMAIFSCTFEGCNKTFKRQDRLKEHVLTHGEVKKHRCSFCAKSFIRLQAYKLHVRSVHEKTYRFKCEKCQKGYNRPDKYNQHKNRCKKGQ